MKACSSWCFLPSSSHSSSAGAQQTGGGSLPIRPPRDLCSGEGVLKSRSLKSWTELGAKSAAVAQQNSHRDGIEDGNITNLASNAGTAWLPANLGMLVQREGGLCYLYW